MTKNGLWLESEGEMLRFKSVVLKLVLPLLACCLVLAPAIAQERRVALVMGNSQYPAAPLRNPPQDVKLIADALKAVGFKVQVEQELDQKQMKRAIRDFGTQAQSADVAFLYYSGHGTQVAGENYLIPLKATIEKEGDYELEAVSANALLRQIAGAKPKAAIVVFDACRDNPFAVSKGSGKGLGRMDAPTGTMIAFATAPNITASDEGHYAKVLAAQIKTPGLELVDVFRNTTAEVRRLTGGRQEPRVSELSITDRVFLAGSGGTRPVPVQANAPQPVVQASPAPVQPLQVDSVVKIGHVGPTSGNIRHLGRDNENGARMAIEDLNRRGVIIAGKRIKFELVTKDDAATPLMALSVARELVDEGVVGVIGHLNSGTSIPAAKIYHDAGIPQITPSATNPALTAQGYGKVFRMVMNDGQLAHALGEYAVTQVGAQSIMIIDDRTSYGQDAANQFENGVRSAGGQILKRESVSDRVTTFDEVLSSVRQIQPDLVFYGGMDTQAAPLFAQMRQMGIQAKLMGGDGICTGVFGRQSGGNHVRTDVICAEPGGILSQEADAFNRFKTQYQARFNLAIQIYAPYSFDAVNVLVDAMKRANSTNPAVYASALAKSRYKGVTGLIRFDSRGDPLGATATLYTYQGSSREVLDVIRMR